MDNRKKKFIRELCEKARVRRESGLFVVEGPKMCSEIPDDMVSEIYVTPDFLTSPGAGMCGELLRAHGFETVTGADMQKMSDTVTPQGIMALVKQKKKISLAEIAGYSASPLLLVLDRIQDPGNLGTMIRTSEAAGATGVIMNTGTVDPYSPKVVRSTMGSIFRVPFLVLDDLGEAVKRLKEGIHAGTGPVQVIATDLKADISYRETDFTKPTAILIGNESKGLSPELAATATKRVIIPMSGRVESLNAAMSAAILLFEASGERRANGRP